MNSGIPKLLANRRVVEKIACLLTYYGVGQDRVPPMLTMTKAEELELWRIRRRSPRARELLVRKYLCLAFKRAAAFHGPRLSQDDAVSAANAGMMEAMDRFNPKGGSPFASFCFTFIRRHLIDALVATYSVKVSDKTRRKFAEISEKPNGKKAKALKDGEATTIEEVFSRLSKTEGLDKISSLHTKQEDAPASPYEASSPADDVETSSLPEEIREGIKTLEPIERRVLMARYYTSPAESFDALGKRLGKTKMFLREVHDEALVKLRKYMQK